MVFNIDFITDVKNDLLLTTVVSTSVQNRYLMSSRTDVNGLLCCSANSMEHFIVLKNFGVQGHPGKALIIKQVN